MKIALSYVRSWCGDVAGHPISDATFSRWCASFAISGRSSTEIDLNVAAALLTCAGLYRFEARSYTGRAYRELYPSMLTKVKEICNVRDC